MNNIKKPNIYWFIIDSVRTYKTGLDDRDRIDIIDELAEQGIEFTNCVTGAPSSLLSAGAIFTGLPSTFVARHFNEWKFTGMEVSSIATLVEKHNYKSYPIMDTRGLREILHKLLPPLKHKELPKGFKLSDYVWRNKEVTQIFKHFMSRQDDEHNHAYILWYDCRRDPKTSDHVKEAIEEIKKRGDFEDSIIIMHSDHGYPDPKSSLNEAYFKDMGHDMVLTDDNIKVPLVVKLPRGPKGLKRTTQVGLVDLLPTIFDQLDIDYQNLNTSFQGQSLLPLIDKEEDRVRRTDTRLPMDVKRIGSFRTKDFKYIYLYHDQIELMYDLKKDPSEFTDISQDQRYSDSLNYFRDLNKQYEEELFLFHDAQIKSNLGKSLEKIRRKIKNQSPRIVLISKGIELLMKLLIKELNAQLNNPEITVIYSGRDDLNIPNVKNSFKIPETTKEHISGLIDGKVDLTLFMTENSSRVFLKKEQIEAVKSIPARRRLLMNYNFLIFNYFKSKWLNITYLKLFLDWETKGYFYKQEPTYFFKDLFIFISGFVSRVFNVLFRNRQNIDLKAARETIYFRKAIMQTNESQDYDDMEADELTNEIKRIHTRED